MTAPASPTRQACGAIQTRRLLNPVTGYGLAILLSAAFWAMLLAAIF